uniref:MYND-type domain-containing protein n=1 Tax=Mycena chlorophos TaxID=658473 RepID=A0ABQ0L9B4_MYCCL|nr:predicted protein [Mycena chlorophos]
MESFGSAFAGLPYFSPMMMINRSETCATTKLLQLRDFGINENDITPKFLRSPENSPDLSREEFVARKRVIEQIDGLEATGRHGLPWLPILSKYEIVKGSAKKARDWGHLLFATATTNQFLLVMIFPDECNCGNYSHHDYESLTKYHANKVLCLAKYIWHTEQSPKWIRATYLTPSSGYDLDPSFAVPQTAGTALDVLQSLNSHPSGRYFHIDIADVKPGLTPSETERIDAVASHSSSKEKTAIKPEVRRVLVVSEENKEDAKPDVDGAAWKKGVKRACAYCEVVPHGKVKLMACSRCKLVQYCGKDCQTRAWPSHKHFCKKV